MSAVGRRGLFKLLGVGVVAGAASTLPVPNEPKADEVIARPVLRNPEDELWCTAFVIEGDTARPLAASLWNDEDFDDEEEKDA